MATIAIKSQIENLPNNAKVNGFTHCVSLSYKDLSETGAGTADTFTMAIPANASISDVLVDVKTPFANTADATNNTTTVKVGDNTAVDTFITAQELNANAATPIAFKRSSGVAPVVYTAANLLKITITPKAATALAGTINQGALRVYFNLIADGAVG